MYMFLLVIHILAAVLLIIMILIQRGRGGGLVESFSGGEKPNVLVAGHTHKSLYVLDRYIHCISAGCVQKQSSWMRGKRIAADDGFWIVTYTVNEQGIAAINPKFFPFYGL